MLVCRVAHLLPPEAFQGQALKFIELTFVTDWQARNQSVLFLRVQGCLPIPISRQAAARSTLGSGTRAWLNPSSIHFRGGETSTLNAHRGRNVLPSDDAQTFAVARRNNAPTPRHEVFANPAHAPHLHATSTRPVYRTATLSPHVARFATAGVAGQTHCLRHRARIQTSRRPVSSLWSLHCALAAPVPLFGDPSS